jgi:hypothetical protein
VTFSGLVMDIDQTRLHHVSKNNNADERKAFSQNIGVRMSAMEHPMLTLAFKFYPTYS